MAMGIEEALCRLGFKAYTLDGDNVRHGLNEDLGFSQKDREENIRRIAHTAALFADSNTICLTSFISPFAKDRQRAREIHERAQLPFFEVFCNASLEVCEQRDVKGLYKKARKGEIPEFTGISMPYEVPEKPDLVLNTGSDSIEICVKQVLDMLIKSGVIPTETVKPAIKELLIDSSDAAQIQAEAQTLPSLAINQVDLQWVQVLSEGWATPLYGFMREKEYLQCLYFGGIFVDGKFHNHTIPIVLAINKEDKERLEKESQITLKYGDKPVAVLKNVEVC